ncbi:hypothetical protein ACWEPA_27210 [Streptomyces filamentosus]
MSGGLSVGLIGLVELVELVELVGRSCRPGRWFPAGDGRAGASRPAGHA